MADTAELKATSRQSTGKTGTRRDRLSGLIPAVIYGGKKQPEHVTLTVRDVSLHVDTGHFLSTIYMLDVEGKKTRVIPRDVQVDPVRDIPLHVDFLRLAKDAKITVSVPIKLINEALSPGLKRGGVLNIVRHDIDLICLSEAIPELINIDLTGLEIGDSLHISSVQLPEGTELTITDRDFTLISIAGAVAAEEEPGAEEMDEEDEEDEETSSEADE